MVKKLKGFMTCDHITTFWRFPFNTAFGYYTPLSQTSFWKWSICFLFMKTYNNSSENNRIKYVNSIKHYGWNKIFTLLPVFTRKNLQVSNSTMHWCSNSISLSCKSQVMNIIQSILKRKCYLRNSLFIILFKGAI